MFYISAMLVFHLVLFFWYTKKIVNIYLLLVSKSIIMSISFRFMGTSNSVIATSNIIGGNVCHSRSPMWKQNYIVSQ
jgi:hypothetical protein